MKIALFVSLIIIVILVFIKFPKIIRSETKTVEAVVAKVNYTPTMIVNKIIKPESYEVLLTYKDVKSWVDVTYVEYTKYSKLVNEMAKANLITDYFDDGRIVKHLRLI